jgi:transposase
MVQAKPTITELDMDKLEDVLRRAEGKLDEEDFAMVKALADAYAYLTEVLGDKNTSIARLRKLLFGAKTEKTARVVRDQPPDSTPSVSAAGATVFSAASAEATTLGAVPAERESLPATEASQQSGSSLKGDDETANDAAGEIHRDAPAAAGTQASTKASGHGRNGADVYAGATRIEIPHPSLQPGDSCPKCEQGTVYDTKRPRVLVRLKGRAPVEATVYSLQKLRCNLCNGLFTAERPAGVGEEKYDATVGSMIALLRYGMGMPMNRNETLQDGLGVPLPDSTQWEIVAEQAERAEPAFEELVRQGAQGDVIYHDDTTVKILALMDRTASAEEQADEVVECGETVVPADGATEKAEAQRTGLFTTGIVAETRGGEKIALFLSGHQHAGENLKDVLARRATDLPPPIQMCDALSRNMPKGLKTILSNCLAHGRRKFVDLAERFPEECRHVLESLSVVYRNDALAKERNLSPAERLLLHQADSGPVMEELHAWLGRQFAERRVEPNSALGGSITYMLRHWQALTLFLRVAGAPLDNNICERALKMAIRHRKNSLFYRTPRGARVGDIFMSLIHTCRLCKANPFDYLTELERHAEEVALNPGAWMPWNYRQAIVPAAAPISAH